MSMSHLITVCIFVHLSKKYLARTEGRVSARDTDRLAGITLTVGLDVKGTVSRDFLLKVFS